MESRRECARIEAEALALEHDEEIRNLRERIQAESTAGRASLERLFLKESLPALAQTLACALQDAKLTVYQSGSEQATAGPLPFALAQLGEVLQSRLAGLHGEELAFPTAQGSQ